jgi:GAF domain-containing protein
MGCDASVVLSSLQAKASETSSPEALGDALVSKLGEAFPRAHWVGLWWIETERLVLGPYQGPRPMHETIAAGVGISGTAIAQDKDQVVDDVRERADHLPCLEGTRSEAIVLVRSMGRVVGELVLASEDVAAFDAVDLCILRTVANSFGGLVHFEGSAPPSP